MPPQIRATVVAFYILMLNLIGLGIGITAGGWMIDHLKATGVREPYSVTLLAFTLLSQLACATVPARRAAVPSRSRASVRSGRGRGGRGLAIRRRGTRLDAASAVG